MSDPDRKLALRIHDEVSESSPLVEDLSLTYVQCNGSDVFGSDICTCRPYLIFGIEEAVKEAQKGGTGVVIYFRKEGRALGEVTKVSYLFTTHDSAGHRTNLNQYRMSRMTPPFCLNNPPCIS